MIRPKRQIPDVYFEHSRDERHRAELPAVDTLDARICPECRRQDVKHIAYREPDLDEYVGDRPFSGILRDAMEVTPCGCRINLRRWGLHGYRYTERWIAWEWRRAS